MNYERALRRYSRWLTLWFRAIQLMDEPRTLRYRLAAIDAANAYLDADSQEVN